MSVDLAKIESSSRESELEAGGSLELSHNLLNNCSKGEVAGEELKNVQSLI